MLLYAESDSAASMPTSVSRTQHDGELRLGLSCKGKVRKCQ
jgi:hypothetical protein